MWKNPNQTKKYKTQIKDPKKREEIVKKKLEKREKVPPKKTLVKDPGKYPDFDYGIE